MLFSRGRPLALLLLCAAVALPSRSEETPSATQPVAAKTNGADKKAGPMPSADAKKAVDVGKRDFASLPADAIVIVCERAAEALQLVPNAVILTPAKYQEMRDEIERLKKLLQVDKPIAPARCHVKGKVAENALLLEADFSVVTDRPGTMVTLACPQARAADARIEGRTPLIRHSESGGFLVRIDKPGEYHVQLDLSVPLATREGNARGFELTLPRAAITTLDLDLPANARDVRVGGRPLGDAELSGLSLKNHRLTGNPALGPVEKLELAWKEVRPPSGVPVLTARGDIRVRLDATGLTTEADLLLKIEGAPTNVWRLLVPLGAKVEVAPPDDARLKLPIETANQKFASLRTLHLKEPSADPLQVRVTAHAPLPHSGSLAPVGPFFVVGAARQTGTVQVRNQMRDLHLDYHEHGDLKLRQLSDESAGDTPAVVAAFTYGNIPQVEKPQGATGPISLSWLDLEAETVRGQVRTRVTHTLTLRPLSPTAGSEGLRWDIVTTIAPMSKWAEVEQLKVRVPPDWSPVEEGVSLVGPENGSRFVVYRSSALQREGASQPIRLDGRYTGSHKSEGRVVLTLPRPQGSVEQCEVKIEGPRGGEVVLNNTEQMDLEPVKRASPSEQTWRCRHVPGEGPSLDVSWRPYRPELRVASVVDLTLSGGRGEVRHEMRLHSPRSLPASIGLGVPSGVNGLEVVEGGSAQAATDSAASPKEILRVALAAKTGGTEGRLVLRYTTNFTDDGQPPRPGEAFAVPLVTPEQGTGGETRVRVWNEPGSLPVPAGGPPWDERDIEEVAGRTDLPVLVLRAPRVDAPLRLRAGEQTAVFTVLVERALVRAQLLEGGGQSYRASFQLRQLAGRYLDVELPGPVPTLNVHVSLNRRAIAPDFVNESGQQTEGGSIARLRLAPELIRRTALLEVSYQLPPSRTGASPLRTTLQPPRLHGAPPVVPTRWLVVVPSGRVPIAPESAAGLERTWTRCGWLLAARLQRTQADFEREFEESLPAELRPESEGPAGETRTTPALVCWRDATEPIALTHAPKQAWLLVCSLGLLIVGLGLYGAARPRLGEAGRMAVWLWPLLALAALTAAVGVLIWPTTFWAIAYGAEPGALVLLGAIGLQWLAQQRYRRQIVFLPSFSRGRAGSSLLRKSAAPRPAHGEPSTVDAPPPGSSGGIGVGG